MYLLFFKHLSLNIFIFLLDDYVPRFPIEELNALAAVEGKTADFLSLLERSIEDAVTHSQENDKN